jgi:hypothetical protein
MLHALKSALRRNPLVAYRLKRLKQAAVTLKVGLSGKQPFDDRPITKRDLIRTIKEAESKTKDKIVVLTDDPELFRYCESRSIAAALITPGSDIPKSIGMAIYAINKYSNGRDVINWLFANRIPFLAVGVDHPSSILTEDASAERAIRDAWQEQLRDGWEKFDLHVGGDFENLFQAVSATRDIPGDYVEIGVFHGSSADATLRYMVNAGIRRRCVFIDAFDGFAYDAAVNSADRRWQGTHTDVIQERTTARLMKHANGDIKVEVRKGDICAPDALTGIEQICVANIDVDLYEAIIAAADHVMPKLSIGGVILIEDAGHGVSLVGARAAVDVIMQRHPGLFHYRTFSGQHMLIKTGSRG